MKKRPSDPFQLAKLIGDIATRQVEDKAMLIDEIIDLLSDEASSLSGALLKTTVLLHKLGKKDLAEWVKHEIEGYPPEVELPPYRVLNAQVYGNASNIAWQFNHHPIPTMHLKDSLRQRITTMRFAHPLNSIEELATGETITAQIPIELCPQLSKGLANGIMVSSAWSEVSATALKGTLMQIRAKILDFLLNLKDSLGDDIEEKDMKKKAETIDTNAMFSNSVFGPNTNIFVGNQNNPNITNVVKSDFESLDLLQK